MDAFLEGERGRCARYLCAAADVKTALLGKTPRYAPDQTFDAVHIRIELSINFKARSVAGRCTTTLRSFAPGLKELSFDAADSMRVREVRLDGGGRLRFKHSGGKLTVFLSRPLAAGEQTTVEVRYRTASPKAGLHFTSRGPVQVWSQGQPEDSRFWFPCHDAPHEKATSEVIATVPKGFTAVSNGVLAERVGGPRTETFHWRMDHPHSVYLISLAAGRFAELAERWEDVPVLYYCELGREEDARRGFGKTPKIMEFFSRKTGVRYPYEKYAQVAVAEFPGGMENTTATTQTDAALIPKEAALDNDMDSLVAHELAHQWFGDLITCRDWAHAWLNEGFATYFEVLFTEHDKGKDEADYEMHHNAQSYFHEDEARYRRPVVCNTYKYPWVLFDRHLYEKGAWVLHMLRRELGDEAWWQAVHHYLVKFRNKSVETSDFIAAIEQASGRNLRRFFDQWVFRAGYPTVQAFYSFDGPSSTARWRLVQKGSDQNGAYALALDFRFSGAGGWVKEFTRTLDQKEQTFEFKLPGRPAGAEIDPNRLVLAKFEVQKPLALWTHELRAAPTGASRIRAAWAAANWGDEAAVAALAAACRGEKFWGAAAEMASALGSIRTRSAFRALKGLLGLPHPKARRAVVSALGGFRREEAGPAFAALLAKDPSLHVQAEAARALGSLRDPRWIPVLRKKLSSRCYWDIVPGGAIQGLANTRDPKVLPILLAACSPQGSYPARAYALRAVGSFAPAAEEAVPKLCALLEGILRESDERLAMTAIQTLSGCGDSRALKTLEKALSHPDTRVKTYAEEAIARIRGESEKPPEKKK